ncbi:flagellar basal body P-ring formation chaperone FlgA [Humisphaera borealis]|uniref:Flagellar basal body P-ring formation protein FlgA n=1 Tax=Humisphaera borealis TaxID=2807512 RepID=A0A7M2X3E1_9BACT|nr:flagellar basal body P-ring formation chaperone FlgA [Humisphaera borealis]QOV91531.1 flagellar basal body P-ring formation protein FlgA [Humisphaera borealis]
MYYGNGRPLTKKQLVRLSLGLTILAWATQTLFAQWGYGAEVATNTPIEISGQPAASPAMPAERFISPRPFLADGGTLELRAEATTFGPEVRLKQVARWSNRDAAFFEQSGELVIARLDARGPYRVIEIEHIRKALADAGVNIGLVKFAGPMSCSVNRSDAKPDTDGALAKWIDASEQKVVITDRDPVVTAASTKAGSADVTGSEPSSVRTLREIVVQDLSARLNVPVDQLQVVFNPKDERLLNLCEPQFKFNLEPQRVRNLGEVSWTVTMAAGDKSQRAILAANARAWQTAAVVTRPISARAPISAADVQEQRTLVDRLSEEPLVRSDQAIGQQAARDLKPGMVLTGRMLESVPMAKHGQLVTVTSTHGAVRLKTVVRAMETGSKGQRIRVKNDTTNEQFDVILTGPQEASMGT